MSIEDAAKSLHNHITKNYSDVPSWLAFVGVDGINVTVALSKRTYGLAKIPDQWEGYPIKQIYTGKIIPA
ncbi:MAG: hypothetical protein DWQ19_11315 [Crenarchaeota archaeon]|nr:MAG: hypothetical protein DWQ19_11315 [Thermoproteota archaeon]